VSIRNHWQGTPAAQPSCNLSSRLAGPRRHDAAGPRCGRGSVASRTTMQNYYLSDSRTTISLPLIYSGGSWGSFSPLICSEGEGISFSFSLGGALVRVGATAIGRLPAFQVTGRTAPGGCPPLPPLDPPPSPAPSSSPPPANRSEGVCQQALNGGGAGLARLTSTDLFPSSRETALRVTG
jgi:hypothetical protein